MPGPVPRPSPPLMVMVYSVHVHPMVWTYYILLGGFWQIAVLQMEASVSVQVNCTMFYDFVNLRIRSQRCQNCKCGVIIIFQPQPSASFSLLPLPGSLLFFVCHFTCQLCRRIGGRTTLICQMAIFGQRSKVIFGQNQGLIFRQALENNYNYSSKRPHPPPPHPERNWYRTHNASAKS